MIKRFIFKEGLKDYKTGEINSNSDIINNIILTKVKN